MNIGEYRKLQLENTKWNFKVDKHFLDKVCYLTGEYFKKDDMITLFFTNDKRIRDLKDKYDLKNLKAGNVWVKTKELSILFDMFENNEEIDELVILINKSKKRKKKLVFTDEQKEKIDAFKKACRSWSYYSTSEAYKKEIICKLRRSSSTLRYNVFKDSINFDSRAKQGMFDFLFINQFTGNVRNEMNKILGVEEVKVLNPQEEVNKVVDDVNKMFR